MAKQIAASTLGTPQDTYLYQLARTQTSQSTFGTIGSDDSLRLFDTPSLKPVNTFQSCNHGVSCLNTFNEITFLTAGRDATVRFWDPRSSAQASQHIVEPKGAGFSAVVGCGVLVAAGTENLKEGPGDVTVLLYDARSLGRPLRSYTESHTDTITQLAFHPTQAGILLSGSTDGLISLFDTNQADEDDALRQVLNPRSAVHCAGFLADDQAYVLTSDEHFSVYGLDKTGSADDQALPTHEYGDVREKLDCMYAISILQSAMLPAPVLAYGHNNKQTLSLAPLKAPSWDVGQPINLPGAHGEEVVRDVMIIENGLALSCGEDGQVRVWDTKGAHSAGDAMEVDTGAKPSKKQSRKDKKAERFAPY